MADLKRLYGLREMAIDVPDGEVKALRKVVKQAIDLGLLPPDASTWIPRSAKGTPAQGTPETEPKAEPPTSPERKAKAKKDKGKDSEPAPRSPIPVDPAVKADLDKSQSAWDRLNQKVADPGVPMKSKVKSEPMKGPEFDPTGIHPDFDLPDLGNRPKSASVNLKKGGDPEAPDWMAGGKKPGVLSRVFGKKKAPQRFDANPFEFEPETPAKPKPSKPDIDKFLGGDEEPESSAGKDAMDDLGDFLGKNPAEPKGSPGNDAMGDLDFALHGKTKRRK